MLLVIRPLCLLLPLTSVSKVSFRLDLACVSWWWLCITLAACHLTCCSLHGDCENLHEVSNSVVLDCGQYQSFEQQMVA